MSIERKSARKKQTIRAGVFKAKCLDLMDRVCAERIEVEVTKRGKPIARLVPLAGEPGPLFGSAPIRILGDLAATTGERWEAER